MHSSGKVLGLLKKGTGSISSLYICFITSTRIESGSFARILPSSNTVFDWK